MKVTHSSQIPIEDLTADGAQKVKIQWLIGENDRAPNFYMRLFEVDEGGSSPRHTHDYEHEVYVLEGWGTVYGEEEESLIGPGSVVLVHPGENHQFRNTGAGPLRFLCIIPKTGK
jgi:quercetin dioxygenase-like cupin family protein